MNEHKVLQDKLTTFIHNWNADRWQKRANVPLEGTTKEEVLELIMEKAGVADANPADVHAVMLRIGYRITMITASPPRWSLSS